MTPPRRKKPDGRRHNGAQKTELSEAAVLVRGPSELLDAVAERAAREHVPVREAWRRAARVWLGWHEVTE